MDTRTGAIAHFEKESDAIRAGFKKQLTPAEAKELAPMNRKARRKWAAEQRASKNKQG